MDRSKLYRILSLVVIGSFLVWVFIIPVNLPKKPVPPKEFDLAGGPEKENRGFPQREIIDLASEYPEIFYRFGPNEKRMVALTFDDGPDDNFTPQILDVLKDHDVPATFFVIGKRCELFPEVLERIGIEGHIIGNHTYTHPDIIKLTNKEVSKEIEATDKIVNELVGYNPLLFRAPYGSIDRKKVEQIANNGYKIIAWDVDSLDWRGLSAGEVKTNILENVTKGSIILQHSAGGIDEDLSGTVEALGEIIEVLKKDGFEFILVHELLGVPYKKELE